MEIPAGPAAVQVGAGGRVDAVVWATGFRRAYPWLHLPVLDAQGEIRHEQGVTPVAGLLVAGMHALMRAGVIQLHRWGLLDRVIATGTPAVRRTVFRYGDASTTVTLKAVGGVDALYAPRRTVLDPILVGAAAEAGADLMFGISVTDVERDAGGRATGILGHDRGRRPVRLRAAVTIGADGLRSTVARAVGAAVERRAAYASASIYAHVSGLETDGYEWLYSPGATAAVIPTNHDQTCVSVGAPQARLRAEFAGDLVASFRQLLAEASLELADRMAAVAAPRRLRGFPGVRGFLRRPWGPGWALVGDAGYYKDPITAHGMSDALRDAELLADAVAAVFAGERTEEAAMRDYHQTRNRLSLGLFAVTEAIASYQWDTRSVETQLRSLSAAMVDEVDHLLALDAGATARLAG